MRNCKNADPLWNDLKIYHAVVNEGSLSGASRRLSISHSTVCRRISRLEDIVGVPLIRRRPNGIIFTKDGQQLGAFVKEMDDRANDILFWIKQKKEDLAGALSLSCCDISLASVSEIVGDLSASHPDVQFDIKVSAMNADLRLASTDLAIRATNSPDESLVGVKLSHFQFQVAKRVGLENDANTNWICLNDSFAHLPAERWLGQKRLQCQTSISVDSYMSAAALIRSGTGIGLLPEFVVENDPFLEVINVDAPLPTWNLWLVYHRSQINNGLVKAFTHHLKQYWSSNAPLLAIPKTRSPLTNFS
ncbi:LysR family transcriptional regulator [Enterovibrio sp. ZSDZ35]|uniref:LysR family transcriptional regulator n=1 Tax=Enterovibrio qingdaonensis TaxID=2899818 RepID=A0ABT5QIB7_9GAMM|nr:LysR family transcriptional regulator [Enterovibrio sp. ZSDZ35]MDD1780210.1 LysR family transcriptional regulator [Enterovibrio sp. ZSDZ35]